MRNRLRMHWRVMLGFCIFSLRLALPGVLAQPGNFNFNYPGPNTIIVHVDPPGCTNVLAGNMGTPTVTSAIGANIIYSAFDPDTSGFQLTDSWNIGEIAHVYWKVADNVGSLAWFEFFINFTDTTRPVINTGGLLPLVEYASIRQVPPPPTLTATDSCPPPVSITFSQTTPPALCQGGIFTRTWLATDLSGNTGVFTQTIVIQPDNSPPTVIAPPQNGSASCVDAATAYPAWVAAQMTVFKATDPSGIASYSNNAPGTLSGNCPAPVTVTFQATDSCGYSTTRTATFTVIDAHGPYTVVAPKDTVAYCTAPANNFSAALADWIHRRAGLVASDSCTPEALLTYSMKVNNIPGDSAQVVAAFLANYNTGCSSQPIGIQNYPKVHGVVRVDFFATDACGTSSLIGHADFGAIDTLPPALTGAALTTEECGGGNDGTALVTWINNHGNASISDLCSTTAWTDFSWTSSSGQTGTGLFNNGPYPFIPANTCNWHVDVSFRATDECGNTGSITLRFRITDTTPPVFAGLQPVDTLFCPNTTPPAPLANVTDNCDAAVTLTSNFQVISPVCSDAYSMLVTWIATDDCGNTKTATQTFVVLDTTKPVIILLPPPVTIRCDTFVLPPAPVLGQGVKATDICGEVTGLTFSDVSNQNPNPAACGHYSYTIVRTFTVADDCGNTSTGQQLITVIDNIPPAFIGFSDTTLVCAVPELPTPPPAATDICTGIASAPALISGLIDGGPCNDSYTHTLTWSSTDVCGNTGYFTQVIQITDTVKPTLTSVPGDVSVECNAIPAPPAINTLVASDNCDEEVDITFQETEIRDLNPANCAHWTNYMIVRQWTVADNCGNSNTYTQSVWVQDNTGPELVAPDTIKIPTEPGFCGSNTVVPTLLSVFDDCTAQKSNITLRDTVGLVANGSPVYEVPVDTVYFSWPSPNLPPAVPAVGNATLAIALDNADSKVLSETFEIWGENGYHIGRTKLVSGFCGSSGDTTFILPAALLNSWLADGQLDIMLSPNGSGAGACNAICPGNRARATLNYAIATQQLPLTVTCSIDNGAPMNYPPANSFFLNAGNHVVTYIAADCAGNSASATTIVRIEDVEPPAVTAPAPITAYVSSSNCLSSIALPFPALSENCAFPANFNQSSPVVPIQFKLDTNSLQQVPKNITLTISGLVPNAVAGGFLKIRHLGDNGNWGEFFKVYDEQGNFLSNTSSDSTTECTQVHESVISVNANQINAWGAGDMTAGFQLRPNIDIVNFSDFINPCGPLDNNKFDGISTLQVSLMYNYATVDYTIKKGPLTVQSGQLSDSQTSVSLPPGSYTVEYRVLDNSGNPGMASYPLTVLDTIRPKAKCHPLISIYTNLSGMTPYTLQPQELNNGSTDNCSGADLSFQLSQSGFNCNMATPPNNLYSVTLTVTDTYGNSATCTGTVQVQTVDFAPTVTSGVCEGGKVQFFANPPLPTTGQLYKWTGPNYLSFAQNPVIQPATSVNEGTYTIQVTGPTGCTAVETVTLDLSNLPTQPAFTPDVPSLICEGANLTLKCQQFGGTVVTYSWYSGTPANSTLLGTTTEPLFLTPMPAPGVHQYFVKVVSDGCTSLPSNVKDITVQQRPLAVVAQEVISVCLCDPILLSATVQPGQNITYQWNGPAGFVSNSASPPPISCAQESNEGAYQLIVLANGCASAPDSAFVTVRTKPSKPLISGLTSVCQGDTILLYCLNEPTAAKYDWISPLSQQFSTDTNFLMIPAAALSDSGFWLLRIYQDNCYSDWSDPKEVRIQVYPNISADSDAPVCLGNPLHLSANSGASGVTYSWSGPNNYSSNLANPTVMIPVTGTYTVTVSTGFLCTNTAEVDVAVIPPPVVNSVTNTAPPCVDCNTFDATLQASVFAPNGPLTYEWYKPDATLLSTLPQPVIPKVCTQHNGTYRLIVRDPFGCVSNQGSTVINVQPEPQRPTLSQDSSISLCVGTSLLLNIKDVSIYGSNISFEWHTPYGIFTQAQPQISIPLTGFQHGGDYWVMAKAGDCLSAASPVVHVAINAIPMAPVASSNSPVCQGDTLVLNASTIPGATTYNWSSSGGFNPNIKNPSIPQVSFLDTGEYKVKVTVNGCTSPEGSTYVTVKTRPGTPTIGQIAPVCLDAPGAVLILEVTQGSHTPQAQYMWYNAQTLDSLGSPAFPLVFQLTNLNGLSAGYDSFFVRAILDGCMSAPSATATVELDTIPDILANAIDNFPACDIGSFPLIGNTPSNPDISGVWSKVGNPPVEIDDPFRDTANVTGGVAGNVYCFAWTFSNGACKNYDSDTVCATVNAFEEARVEDSLIYTCFADSFTLHAVQGKYVDGVWSQAPGQIPLNVQIGDKDNPTTVVSNLQPRQRHLFYWTLKTAGCPASVATVELYNIGRVADGGPPKTICSLDPCTTLDASELDGFERGKWWPLDNPADQVILSPEDPKSKVCNLHIGANRFLWVTNDTLCGDLSRDTALVNYDLSPVANTDTLYVGYGQQVSINALQNDIVPADSKVEVIQEPKNGTWDEPSKGVFTYLPQLTFSDTDELKYRLCNVNPDCPCSIGTIYFVVGKAGVCRIPNIITPNGDGANDYFVIPEECLSSADEPLDNEVTIFNQWGDQVYHKKQYDNKWDGTYNGEPLPAGTYYYVIKLPGNSKLQKGFLLIQR